VLRERFGGGGVDDRQILAQVFGERRPSAAFGPQEGLK